MKHKIKEDFKKSILIKVIISLAIVLILVTTYGIYVFYKSKNYDSKTMFIEKDNQIPISIPSIEPTVTPEPLSYGLELSEGRVLYDDKIYEYNKDIINILLIGIDKESEGLVIQSKTITGGQADTIAVLSIDTRTNIFTIIRVPRDTIADVVMLDSDYNYAATVSAPICTSHSYGDGEELSSELTMDAVSRLLYDIPINRYFTLNLNAISDIVNKVDGITLEMLDDFTKVSWRMEKGKTVQLNGYMAKRYITARSYECMVGEDLGSRMPRQSQFMLELYKIVKEKAKSDITFPLFLLEVSKENTLHNLSFKELSFLTSLILENELNVDDIITLPGKMSDNGYIIDDEETHRIIIDTYYNLIDVITK